MKKGITTRTQTATEPSPARQALIAAQRRCRDEDREALRKTKMHQIDWPNYVATPLRKAKALNLTVEAFLQAVSWSQMKENYGCGQLAAAEFAHTFEDLPEIKDWLPKNWLLGV